MRRFIGLMSGTSLDGIDAALVSFDDAGTPRLDATHGEAMPDELRHVLWRLCHQSEASFADLARAEEDFSQCQARAVEILLERQSLSPEQITAIGSHGQTIEHAPYGHDGGPAYTLQLDNPSRLAELTGCCVVADFRRRDLAADGQAAPLAPIFHHAVFSQPDAWRAVLNLGGFANLTLLPPSELPLPPLGFDTGPANVLLDAWHERHRQARFDADGAWAAAGQVDGALLTRLLDEPFFRLPPPRSTGREVFHLDWLEKSLRGMESPQDVQATLAELTAVSIARGLKMASEQLNAPPQLELIPCGGGARNRDLLRRLSEQLPAASLLDSAGLGWPADWLEAAAFAWLARQRLLEQPGNLPSVTGAVGPRVLGGIYAR